LIIFVAVNGEKHELNCKDFDGFQVGQFLNLYTKMSGKSETRLVNYQYTNHPSIQGPWTPWTNKDPEMAVADLINDKKWSVKANMEPSATEMVLEMFKRQQLVQAADLDEKQTQ